MIVAPVAVERVTGPCLPVVWEFGDRWLHYGYRNENAFSTEPKVVRERQSLSGLKLRR